MMRLSRRAAFASLLIRVRESECWLRRGGRDVGGICDDDRGKFCKCRDVVIISRAVDVDVLEKLAESSFLGIVGLVELFVEVLLGVIWVIKVCKLGVGVCSVGDVVVEAGCGSVSISDSREGRG